MQHPQSTPALRLAATRWRAAFAIGVLLAGLGACSGKDPAAAGREALSKGDVAAAVVHFKSGKAAPTY